MVVAIRGGRGLQLPAVLDLRADQRLSTRLSHTRSTYLRIRNLTLVRQRSARGP